MRAGPLAAAMRELLAVLDHDQSFVAGPLRILTAHLTEVIVSYLGLQVLLPQVGYPFRLTSFLRAGDTHEVKTSIVIPLAALGMTTQHGEITFYASAAGAFVDLAADLTFALGLGHDVITIDDDPAAMEIVNGMDGLDGLDEISAINRAVGVLIAEGSPAAESLARLENDALRAGGTVHDQALAVLRSTRPED